MLATTCNERYANSKLSNITNINNIHYYLRGTIVILVMGNDILLCIISTHVYLDDIVSILKSLIHSQIEFVSAFYLQNIIPSESINTIMFKSLEINVNRHKLRALADKQTQLRDTLSVDVLPINFSQCHWIYYCNTT